MRRSAVPIYKVLSFQHLYYSGVNHWRMDWLEDTSGLRRHRGLEFCLRWIDRYLDFGGIVVWRVFAVCFTNYRISVLQSTNLSHLIMIQAALLPENESIDFDAEAHLGSRLCQFPTRFSSHAC